MIIGWKEFRDRLRSGWVIACMGSWLAVISLTSIFGLIQMGHIGVQGYERTAASLLNIAQYLVPLLGLLVAHDLIIREREDRTLQLILASGVSRTELIFGKFLGGALAVSVPLVTGFAIAGTLIGAASRDVAFAPFLKLALSGLVLGILFNGIGLLASAFARSRVQALVCALLAWGVVIFAFDLAALGVIVSTNAVGASHEIDVLCDATHVNAKADIHSSFDESPAEPKQAVSSRGGAGWLWLNPVDIFRVANLPSGLSTPLPAGAVLASVCAWFALPLAGAAWRLKRIDL